MTSLPNPTPHDGLSAQRGKIACIVSAFPTLPETFVLYEMVEMEKLGMRIELYPLRRLQSKLRHPEADAWMKRAHYRPFLSPEVLRSQWRFIRRNATRYFRLWIDVLRATWGSADFFFGAIAIFPKAVLFADEMMRERIEHVHAHFANHPATAAFIIHRLTGIPFSFTARGTDVQVDRHMLREKVQEAEFAVAVSNHNKQIIVDHCGRSAEPKVRVIHGGVNVDRLAPQSSARPLQVLCLARFEEIKGHTFLIEACRLLQERNTAFECRLVGDGNLRSKIERQIGRAGLQGRIFLLGELPYPAVIQQLWQADVVVLPTAPTANGKREGIPNVLKEAMACGLPVVASRSGGIPELVDDNQTGLLVPPKDAVALANAFERLANDRALRERLGSAAREKVVRQFNLRISTVQRAQLFLGKATLENACCDAPAAATVDIAAPAALQSA